MSIPFAVEKVFGRKSRVPVKGTINGFPYRTSIMPRGDGTHYMVVARELQIGAKATAGDSVKVSMEMDREERILEIPEKLQRAIRTDAEAAENFASLSYSHRKEYVDWIATAKKPGTKVARTEKALAMLRAGKFLR